MPKWVAQLIRTALAIVMAALLLFGVLRAQRGDNFDALFDFLLVSFVIVAWPRVSQTLDEHIKE